MVMVVMSTKSKYYGKQNFVGEITFFETISYNIVNEITAF